MDTVPPLDAVDICGNIPCGSGADASTIPKNVSQVLPILSVVHAGGCGDSGCCWVAGWVHSYLRHHFN